MDIAIKQYLKNFEWAHKQLQGSKKHHKMHTLWSPNCPGILVLHFPHYLEDVAILLVPVEHGPRHHIQEMHATRMASCSCKVWHCCLVHHCCECTQGGSTFSHSSLWNCLHKSGIALYRHLNPHTKVSNRWQGSSSLYSELQQPWNSLQKAKWRKNDLHNNDKYEKKRAPLSQPRPQSALDTPWLL
jgi:hypothetical protein